MEIVLIVSGIAMVSYVFCFLLLSRQVRNTEKVVIAIFLQKVAKIPALIEVMRPYVAKKESFHTVIELHTQAMIENFNSLYDILGLNAKVQNEFLFLMKLSVHIPSLQKDEYFLYIRDFIIEYERLMRSHFAGVNQAIKIWNIFIQIKNMTIIGLALPGARKMPVK